MLETCRTVDEAVAVLRRIAVPMSQNVTVLDRSGAYATVFMGPDRVTLVTDERVCTNHQDRPGFQGFKPGAYRHDYAVA